MALKIRLRQMGRANKRCFRLVLADSRSKRDGKYLEKLGAYDPHIDGENVTMNHERLTHWLDHGAVLTENARSLVAKAAPEVYRNLVNREIAKKAKDKAKRKARKSK